MNCTDARDLVPEAALDVLDAPVRADVLAHLASCPSCRAELGALSAAADALLLAVPPVEPPAGFESRVAARMVAPRRRRWVTPALAAAAALVIGLIGGWTLRPQHRPGLEAAWLVGADSQPVGQLLVSDASIVCILDHAPAGASYEVGISVGGRESDLGRFTTDGPGKAWTAPLPVHGRDVTRVVIRDGDGAVRATATV